MINKSASKYNSGNRTEDGDILQEISRLSSEMSDLKNDLRFYIRKTETGMISAACSGMKNNAIDILSKGYKEEIKEVMDIIAGECPMHDRCSAVFSSVLTDMIQDYRRGELDDIKSEEYRQKLLEMRESAPYPSCKNCFDKNECIFDRSVKSCASFQNFFSGRTNREEEMPIQEIKPEDIVSSYLEPLANRHRFRVMQELYYGPKSFSELSESTGLRGGNLLFHLEKLVNTAMILQKQERGVYVLSEKGAGALKVCTGLTA